LPLKDSVFSKQLHIKVLHRCRCTGFNNNQHGSTQIYLQSGRRFLHLRHPYTYVPITCYKIYVAIQRAYQQNIVWENIYEKNIT